MTPPTQHDEHVIAYHLNQVDRYPGFFEQGDREKLERYYRLLSICHACEHQPTRTKYRWGSGTIPVTYCAKCGLNLRWHFDEVAE